MDRNAISLFCSSGIGDLGLHANNINTVISCELLPDRMKLFQENKPSDSYGIAAMMSQVSGWERTSQIRRQPLYGRQRLYRRTM